MKTLVLMLLLCSSSLIADDIPIYVVSGDVTLAGNSNCSDCSATVAFSFDFDYQPVVTPQIVFYEPFVTSFETSWPALLPGPGAGGPLYAANGYIPMFDAGGDEVDLWVENSSTSGIQFSSPTIQQAVPSAPVLTYADLYNCQTATCTSDFFPGSGTTWGPQEALSNVVVHDPSPTHTPEPPSELAVIPAVGLMMFLYARRERDAKQKANA